jgi:hypothetical protein
MSRVRPKPTNPGNPKPGTPGNPPPKSPFAPTNKSTGGGLAGGIAKVIGVVAAVIGSVFLALKLLPQAVAEAYWGWLPEEYRMPACSSCCCSFMFASMLALVAAFAGYMG